jgi:hypothetical protein
MTAIITIVTILISGSSYNFSINTRAQTSWTCVSLRRRGKKKQNPSIPNRIWREHETSMINTRRPNHHEIQSVTAVKRFSRQRIAVTMQ